MELHPIKLAHIRPSRVHVEVAVANPRISPGEARRFTPSTTNLQMGHGDVQEGPKLLVSLGCELVWKEDQLIDGKAPYVLEAQVTGLAVWDRAEIDDGTVLLWAKQGAPYTLFPYLRALVTEVSALIGYPPVVLPLLVLPFSRTLPDKIPTHDPGE